MLPKIVDLALLGACLWSGLLAEDPVATAIYFFGIVFIGTSYTRRERS